MKNLSILMLGSLALAACSASGPTPPAPLPPDARFDAGPFTVAGGSELVMCTYVRGTNEVDADVTSFGTEQTHGGHHLIVYTIDHAIDLPPQPCSQGGQPSWSQIAGSQIPKEDTNFPAGVGYHVKAHQQYVMETHFINTSAQPITVKSNFTERFAKAGEVTQRAASYFFGTMNIDIAPHSSFSKSVTCSPPVAVNARTMFAHQHQRGTGLQVDTIAGGASAAQRVYETKLWDGPPIQSFASGMMIAPTDSVRVNCNWQNDSDQRLRYPHEMCFAVGYYWPAENGIFCSSAGQNDDKCICRMLGDGDSGAGGSRALVKVTRTETITDSKGDLAGGAPIYCALFRAEDWAVFGPKLGTQPKYLRDAVDVALESTADFATLAIEDVTPGDYAVTCMMDTIGGGFFPGKGDAVNLNAPKITTVTGQTSMVDVKLDFAVP